MLDRISLILRTKNISAAQFADTIDVQRSSVSHVLSGRNKPSLEFIQKILKSYPEIEPDWMLFGKGPMLVGGNDLFSTSNLKQQDLDNIHPGKSGVDEKSEIVIPETQDGPDTPILDQKQGFLGNNTDDTEGRSIEKIIQTSKRSIKNTENLRKVEQLDELNKTIDKIIIFYDDKSFSVYYPED